MTTFAISSWPCKYPDDLVGLATSTGFAGIEWDLNYIPLPLSQERRLGLFRRLEEEAIEVRYHLPYSTVDIGADDSNVAHVSELYLSLQLDLLGEHGPFDAVVHIGSGGAPCLSELPALARLVERAASYDASLAVENLLTGPTSDPSTLRTLVGASGAAVALDVGHARSLGRLDEFVAFLGESINHVHFYSMEDEWHNHCPFDDAGDAQAVASKIEQECHPGWWTFEMDSSEACIRNRRMLEALSWEK